MPWKHFPVVVRHESLHLDFFLSLFFLGSIVISVVLVLVHLTDENQDSRATHERSNHLASSPWKRDVRE